MIEHADRGRVDEPLGLGQGVAEIASGARASGPETVREPGRDPRRPVLVGVEQGQPLDAKRESRVRHRRARAARAELDHALERRIGQVAPETFGKSRPVGVVADPAAVLEHDRIDRAECPRILGQAVEQRDHRLLARMGDVEAGKACPLGRQQEVRQGFGVEVQGLEVDRLVDVAQALLGALALVHRRRARTLDPGADQAGEDGARQGGRERRCGHPRSLSPGIHACGTAARKAQPRARTARTARPPERRRSAGECSSEPWVPATLPKPMALLRLP